MAATDRRLEELLDQMAPMSRDPMSGRVQPAVALKAGALPGVAMRTALPVRMSGGTVSLKVRGMADEIGAELAAGVDREVIADAITNGDAVIIECVDNEAPLVVGVLHTRIPQQLNLRARKIVVEGEQEVLLRSGRSAMRFREDGDVELVGSRIATMSRGLFRLVGRVLRLN